MANKRELQEHLDGVLSSAMAYCNPCEWKGPGRSLVKEARHDLLEHRAEHKPCENAPFCKLPWGHYGECPERNQLP